MILQLLLKQFLEEFLPCHTCGFFLLAILLVLWSEKKIDVGKLSAFLKSIETSEESNIVLIKSCNGLSFDLPFTLKDTEGAYGTAGDSYLLNYDCNSSITKQNGTFTGTCQFIGIIGEKQVTDIVDLFGKPRQR